jgi:bifunctional enzyme Fae/Hps
LRGQAGADILVVGHAITASKDIEHAADEFPGQINRDESGLDGVMTDF